MAASTTTTKPQLELRQLTPADIPTYQDIRNLVFTPTVNKILYGKTSGIYSASTRDSVIAKYQSEVEKDSAYFVGCFNAAGTMIAAARWRLEGYQDDKVTPRTQEQHDADKSLSALGDPYPESDVQVWNAFFKQMNDAKTEYMGARPYMCLDTLITHPEHRRQGAAKLLVEWGCKNADERGIEAYLESSQMGVPLYEGCGFRRVGEIWADVEGGRQVFVVSEGCIGGESWLTNVVQCMIRPARS